MNPPACPVCEGSTVPYAEKDGYLFWRCAGCGALFVWPFLTRPPEEIYGASYFGGAADRAGYVDYDAEKPALDGLFRSYLALMARRLPSRGTLLDVGAATGHFVGLAAKEGWDASGIDVSTAGAAQAQAKGMRVTCATLDGLQAPPASFDAITMWDVIEHLPDPVAALRKCQALLKPGGLLAVITPDAGSLWARLWGKRWHSLVPPEHVFMFTSGALCQALRKTGFEVLETRSPVKSFTMPYILSTASRWTGIKPLARLGATIGKGPLARLALPVPIRDNVFVLARKP